MNHSMGDHADMNDIEWCLRCQDVFEAEREVEYRAMHEAATVALRMTTLSFKDLYDIGGPPNEDRDQFWRVVWNACGISGLVVDHAELIRHVGEALD